MFLDRGLNQRPCDIHTEEQKQEDIEDSLASTHGLFFSRHRGETSRWCFISRQPFSLRYSSYTSPHRGGTAKWRPWTPTSLTATASQPAASTAKRATWWTTATAAWCTCPVGNHTRVIPGELYQAQTNVGWFCSCRRRSVLHPWTVQGVCWPSSGWDMSFTMSALNLWGTDSDQSRRHVLSRAHTHTHTCTSFPSRHHTTGLCSSSLQISWWNETTTSACVRRPATPPGTAKSCPSSRSPARSLQSTSQRNTTSLSSTSSKEYTVLVFVKKTKSIIRRLAAWTPAAGNLSFGCSGVKLQTLLICYRL